ncbi:MAG: ABC transporter permease [Campylobacteraceae bacterium]
MSESLYSVNFSLKNLAPSFSHIFGTDFLGRDMFARTIKGLSNSIFLGLLAAFFSSIIALLLSLIAVIFGGVVDEFINWLVDMFISIPHIILLILISIMLGGGMFGVIVGISLSHWPSLTRVLRAEVLQIRDKPYIKASRNFGNSKFYVACKHFFPHLLPQYLIGLLLLFPHAILHESAITFLGFGLSIDTPAIGNILAEAMKHLGAGRWWLAFFPGFALLLVVMSFDFLANKLRQFLHVKGFK